MRKNSIQQQVNVSHFFQVSEVLFYLTNLFVFVGLIIYTAKDIANFFIPLGLADLIVLFIQLLLLFLVIAGVVSRNTAMATLLILSIFLFQLSAFVNSSAGGNVSLQIAITTFISLLFASLAAFTVSKYMALAVGTVNLVFFITITLVYQDRRMMDDLVFFSIIIVGYSVAMYYYRHSLENLAESLYASYQTVKKQKVELETLKEKAEQINEVNRPFVVFGRNTSGLVHDFKNEIGLLDSSRQLLRKKIDGEVPVSAADIDDLDSHIQRLSERVDTIKFVVTAGNSREAENIAVSKLINAALYPFRLTSELKDRIVFEELLEGDAVITAPRYRLVQILENLIRNSCEAIVDDQDDQAGSDGHKDNEAPGSIEQLLAQQSRYGKVRVEGRRIEGGVLLAVEDNGPGIGFCQECPSGNCIDCAHFEIGKTTKPYGSGIGMVSVLEAIDQLRGGIRITSSPDRGTRVEILLPPNPDEELSEHLVQSLGFARR